MAPSNPRPKTIEDIFQEAANKLKTLQNYKNKKIFAEELLYWLEDLEHFYNIIVPGQTQPGDSPNPSKSFYNLSPRPSEGDVVYVNLRRGYPKEVYDGHYCYILKDFGTKYLVIPTTSVKDNSVANPDFELDIKLGELKSGTKPSLNPNSVTRLQISDIRTIDPQRIKPKKGYFEVITDTNLIKKSVAKIINLNENGDS